MARMFGPAQGSAEAPVAAPAPPRYCALIKPSSNRRAAAIQTASKGNSLFQRRNSLPPRRLCSHSPSAGAGGARGEIQREITTNQLTGTARAAEWRREGSTRKRHRVGFKLFGSRRAKPRTERFGVSVGRRGLGRCFGVYGTVNQSVVGIVP